MRSIPKDLCLYAVPELVPIDYLKHPMGCVYRLIKPPHLHQLLASDPLKTRAHRRPSESEQGISANPVYGLAGCAINLLNPIDARVLA